MRRNLLIFAMLISGVGLVTQVRAAEPGAAAAPQAVPLYRFQKGSDIAYAAMLEHRKMLEKEGGWQPMGVVGHVFTTKVSGSQPLLGLYKPGASFFYTPDLDEALKRQNEGWSPIEFNKGIVCYVTVWARATLRPVSRYVQPTKPVSYLYAFGKNEDAQFANIKSLKKERDISFYVWTAPIDASMVEPKPDLAFFGEPKATESSVISNVYSIGPVVFKERVLVMVTAYKPDNSVAWQQSGVITQPLGTGTPASFTVNLPPGKNLSGLRYKVKIDANNAIDETNEGNNETGFLNGPLSSGTDTFATIDLSTRQVLYLVSPSGQKVLGKSATPNSPLKLKKSEAVACPDRCVYRLGLLIFRKPAQESLSVYTQFKSAEGGSSGNTLTFEPGKDSKELVIELGLRVGVNTVSVEVDRQNTVGERDETNNKFEVKITVEP